MLLILASVIIGSFGTAMYFIQRYMTRTKALNQLQHSIRELE